MFIFSKARLMRDANHIVPDLYSKFKFMAYYRPVSPTVSTVSFDTHVLRPQNKLKI